MEMDQGLFGVFGPYFIGLCFGHLSYTPTNMLKKFSKLPRPNGCARVGPLFLLSVQWHIYIHHRGNTKQRP